MMGGMVLIVQFQCVIMVVSTENAFLQISASAIRGTLGSLVQNHQSAHLGATDEVTAWNPELANVFQDGPFQIAKIPFARRIVLTTENASGQAFVPALRAGLGRLVSLRIARSHAFMEFVSQATMEI
jgi:regulator of replication initiation timing